MREDAVNFLRNLRGKVKIVTHRDIDGVCSLAILLNFLETREVEEEHEFMEAYLDKLNTTDQMIFLDISLDNILKFATDKTLVIDHHPYSKKIDKITFYNPRENDPESYIPTTYLIYEVISEIEDIDEMKWIVAVGIVGDRGDLNSEFCRNFIKDFDYEKLELAARFIFSADLIDHNKGLEKALQILKKSKKLDEVLDNIYLKYCYDEVQREIQNSKKKIEKEDNVFFIEIDTKYNIKSIIASNFLDKYKDAIVIAYYSRENYYYISGRTNTNLNIGKIFGEVAKTCGGSGGGHEKAAGARIKKDKIELFKEEFLIRLNYLNLTSKK